MKTDYADRESLDIVLRLLTPQNRLVMRVCMDTGLRVSDVLALRTGKLQQRMTVKEMKTGKSMRIYLSQPLYDAIARQAGRWYVFEARSRQDRPRSRQAVWKDVKRAAAALRMEGNIAPHTARKMRAVEELQDTGSIAAVQRRYNHRSAEVTMIYAMADMITARKLGGSRKRRSAPER